MKRLILLILILVLTGTAAVILRLPESQVSVQVITTIDELKNITQNKIKNWVGEKENLEIERDSAAVNNFAKIIDKSTLNQSGLDVVVIHLTNGGKITGTITKENENGVMVDVGYGTIGIARKQIQKIEKATGSEEKEILKTWDEQKEGVKEAGKNRKRNIDEYYKRIKENLRLKVDMAERARRSKEHIIKFTDPSRIMVKAVLNDRVKTTLLLDTGATSVLVSQELARQIFKIEPDLSRTISVRLADGTVRQGVSVVLESVEVGGIVVRNVEAVMMDLNGGSGLLGMSFLNRVDMRIDSSKKELILKDK